MKRNPAYRRLLRIEVTLILFLVLCILIVKSCFRPHEREASQPAQQVFMLTEPESSLLPEDAGGPAIPSETTSIRSIHEASSTAGEEIGFASYYQSAFHGHLTASGENYDLTQYTAAHRELPFGAQVRVTNIENGKQVTVRINDRGPHKQERIIDLSEQAARALDLFEAGVAQVKLEVLN